MSSQASINLKSTFAVINNFLDTEFYNNLKDSFPDVKNQGVRAMNDLYCEDREYLELIAKNKYWNDFHNLIFSKNFWDETMKSAFNSYFTQNFKFDPYFRESRCGTINFSQFNEKFLYGRIDIGVATAGYGINNGGRGNHIDNVQRVVSGLLYFTDQSELVGGEFQQCTENGQVLETVQVRENKCVLSIQDKNAWHKVNPLKSGTRKFIYFSLNTNWDFHGRANKANY